MKKLFPEYYPPSEGMDVQWRSCTFVLDANVLLAPYRLPKEGSEDLLKLLEAVKDRLWVPYQAALEYQRNKLSVISDQKAAVSQVLTHIDKITKELEKGLASHLLVKPEAIIREAQAVLERHKEELKAIEAAQPDVHEPDEIGNRIDALVEQVIGAAPSQDVIDAINKDGEIRYTHQIPPGFKDASKSDIFVHRGVRYQAKFGDLYLWKQTLGRIADANLEYVVLVTGDQKDDWWHRVRGKTIGAPPELQDEAQQHGARHFHMYSLPQFLEFGKAYLGGEISSIAIEQANELSAVTSENPYEERPGLYVKTLNHGVISDVVTRVSNYLAGRENIWGTQVPAPDGFIIAFPQNSPRTALQRARDYASSLQNVRAVEFVNVPEAFIPAHDLDKLATRVAVVLNVNSTDVTLEGIGALAREYFADFAIEERSDIVFVRFPNGAPTRRARGFASHVSQLVGVSEAEVQ